MNEYGPSRSAADMAAMNDERRIAEIDRIEREVQSQAEYLEDLETAAAMSVERLADAEYDDASTLGSYDPRLPAAIAAIDCGYITGGAASAILCTRIAEYIGGDAIQPTPAALPFYRMNAIAGAITRWLRNTKSQEDLEIAVEVASIILDGPEPTAQDRADHEWDNRGPNGRTGGPGC